MENVEIRNIKQLDHKLFRAKFDVAFITKEFGTIVVKGFRIAPSDYTGVWIQEPSYLAGGRYIRLFFLETKAMWEKLGQFILEKCEEDGIPILEANENVDAEEVIKDMERLEL